MVFGGRGMVTYCKGYIIFIVGMVNLLLEACRLCCHQVGRHVSSLLYLLKFS